MLNQLCLLSRDWEKLVKESGNIKQALLIFMVDAEQHGLHELFQMLNTPVFLRHAALRFSMCIDFRGTTSAGIVLQQCNAFISNLVFHPSFYVEEAIPRLFYISAGMQEKDVHYQKLITDQFQAQGYAGVKWITAGEDQSDTLQESVPVFELQEPHQLYETYSKEFLANGHINKYVVVHDRLVRGPQWEEQMQQAEEVFSREQPLLFQLMQRLSDTWKANTILNWEKEKYKAEVENYKTYLQLIHSQDEAGKINAFYHNEYEVLPLWYKRLGHVIKVVIGKRTFTSLYDNGAKKYKS